MPPKPCIWRLASSCCGMAGQAGIDHLLDPGMALQEARRRPWRCCNGAPCAAPASSGRAAPGSCRTGPAMAPTAFCRKVRRSRRSAFSPTTSTPPTMSEWPFRYLVAECMTMSKPCSSGRCTQGLAKVLSQTVMMPRLRASGGQRREVGQLQQRVGRRLDPDHAGLRPDRRLEGGGVGQVDEAEGELGRALAHPARTAAGCRRRDRPWRPRGRRCRAAPAAVAVAARPEAKAKPAAPLSRSAMQRS